MASNIDMDDAAIPLGSSVPLLADPEEPPPAPPMRTESVHTQPIPPDVMSGGIGIVALTATTDAVHAPDAPIRDVPPSTAGVIAPAMAYQDNPVDIPIAPAPGNAPDGLVEVKTGSLATKDKLNTVPLVPDNQRDSAGTCPLDTVSVPVVVQSPSVFGEDATAATSTNGVHDAAMAGVGANVTTPPPTSGGTGGCAAASSFQETPAATDGVRVTRRCQPAESLPSTKSITIEDPKECAVARPARNADVPGMSGGDKVAGSVPDGVDGVPSVVRGKSATVSIDILVELLEYFKSLTKFSAVGSDSAVVRRPAADIQRDFDSLWKTIRSETQYSGEVSGQKGLIDSFWADYCDAEDRGSDTRKEAVAVAMQLCELLKTMRPLDSDLLINLIAAAEDAGKQIAGRDVVLLLGESGSGKSTTVHFFSGAEMCEEPRDGFFHIYPKTILPGLEDVKSDPSTRSVTRVLRAVDIGDGLVVCDTPGFGDTDGAEYDIANGCGIYAALSSARSVKLVYLLSKANFDRVALAISRVNKILSDIAVDMNAILPSVSYVFTKWEKRFATMLHIQLEKMQDECSADQKLDTRFMALISDMIAKTTPTCTIFDPLKDNKDELIASITAVPPIRNTSDVFKNFASPESYVKLSAQLRVLERQVTGSLQSGNVDSLEKAMHQLLMLSKLGLSSHYSSYDDSVKLITEHVRNQLRESSSELESALNDGRKVSCKVITACIRQYRKLFALSSAITMCAGSTDSLLYAKNYIAQCHMLLWNKVVSGFKAEVESAESITTDILLSNGLCVWVRNVLAVTQAVEINFFRVDENGDIVAQEGIGGLMDTAFFFELSDKYYECVDVVEKLAYVVLNQVATANVKSLSHELDKIDCAIMVLDSHKADHSLRCSKATVIDTFWRESASEIQNVVAIFKPEEIDTVLLTEDAVANFAAVFDKLVTLREDNRLLSHTDIRSLACDLEGVIDDRLTKYFAQGDVAVRCCLAGHTSAVWDTQSVATVMRNACRCMSVTLHSDSASKNMLKWVQSLKDQVITMEGVYERLLPDFLTMNPTEEACAGVARCLRHLNAAAECWSEFDRFFREMYDQCAASLTAKLASQLLYLKTTKFDIGDTESALILRASVSATTRISQWEMPAAPFAELAAELLRLSLKIIGTTLCSVAESVVNQPFEIDELFFHQASFCDLMSNSIEISTLKSDELAKASAMFDRFTANFARMLGADASVVMKFASLEDIDEHPLPHETLSQAVVSLSSYFRCLQSYRKLGYDRNISAHGNERLCCQIYVALPRVLLGTWCEGKGSKLAQLLQTVACVVSGDSDNAHLLQHVAFLASDLSPLDVHMNNCDVPERFSTVAAKAKSTLQSFADDIANEMELALRMQNYGTLKDCLSRSDGSNIEGVAKKKASVVAYLNDSANKICGSIRQTRYSGGEAMLVKLLKSMEGLEDLLAHVGKWLVHGTVAIAQDTIRDSIAAISEYVCSRLALCKEHVCDRKFAKADAILIECESVCRTCSASELVLLYLGGKNKAVGHISEQCDEMKLTLRSAINEAVAAFAEIPPSSYVYDTHSPVRLYDELQNCHGEKYDEASRRFKELVVGKFSTLLIELKNGMEANLTASEENLKALEVSIFFLPQVMRDNISNSFQSCQQKLAEIRDKELRLQREIKDGDIIARNLSAYISSARAKPYPDYSRMSRCMERIRGRILLECEKFRSDIDRGDVLTLFTHLPAAYMNWASYSRTLRKMPVVMETLRYCSWTTVNVYRDDIATGAIDTLFCDFWKFLKSPLASLANFGGEEEKTMTGILPLLGKQVNVVKAGFNMMTSVRTFYKLLCDPSVGLEPDIKSSFTAFLCKLQKLLQKFTEHLVKATSDRDVAQLKTLMDTLLEVEEILSVLRNEFHSEAIFGLFPRFGTFLASYPLYSKSRDSLSSAMNDWKDILDQQFLHNPLTTTGNAQDRVKFFSDIFRIFVGFREIRNLSNHVNPKIFDAAAAVRMQENHIRNQLNLYKREMKSVLSDFGTDNIDAYKVYNMCYDNLMTFTEQFKDGKLSAVAASILTEVNKPFEAMLRKLREKVIRPNGSIDDVVDALLGMKTIGVHVLSSTASVDEKINASICRFLMADAKRVALLSLRLSTHENPMAKRLLQEHEAFKDYQIYARNQITLTFGIDDVLGKMKATSGGKNVLRGDDIDKENFKRIYEDIDNFYWKIVEDGRGLTESTDRSQFLEAITNRAHGIAADGSVQQDEKYKKLMAYVFSYWTLSKQFAKEPLNGDVKFSRTELLQPHCAQIIAMCRLLGIDCGGVIQNHLAQIHTGEGKSVTLAGTAIILSLTGRDVDCACYSEYLSKRDYSDFRDLFAAFGVSKCIRYGTFDKLCESFINRRGDIRSCVESMIEPLSTKKLPMNASAVSANSLPLVPLPMHRPTTRPRVLLIDEVDVFLNEDFYGSCYHPVAKLHHPTISAMFEHVWERRKHRRQLYFSNIQKSEAYNALISAFPSWTRLMENMVKEMCYEVRSYATHDCIIDLGRVGYKDQDGVSFTRTYGFKTIFQYFNLREKSIVMDSAIEKHKYFPIDCGTFSYAEVPKMYDHILGVSGTLETLSDKETELLQHVYNIRNRSIIPSVYGQNKLLFRGNNIEDVKIESEGGYHIAIADEITKRLRHSSGYDRAVLVFFESIATLNAFYESRACKSLGMEKFIINEETSPSVKDGYITSAVTSGRVTLLTKAFGRGTDFICYDDRLQDSGGVHVIQTFFSAIQSEETQIMGRSARQGNVGSFSFVLLDSDLAKYQIDEHVIAKMRADGVYYAELDRYRGEYFAKQYPDDMKYVDDIRADHLDSMKFVGCLIDKANNDFIRNYLLKRNIFVGVEDGNDSSRTMVLMDGTSSMTSLIDKAKNKVNVMFARANDILTELGLTAGFELQFCVYRNYNSREHLLDYSPWSNSPEYLRSFLRSVNVRLGHGMHEAVEIGMWHANEEHKKEPISQVILIGDAAPNTREETDKKRLLNSWSNSIFSEPVYFEDELKKAVQSGIIVNAFYINNTHARSFRDVSKAFTEAAEIGDGESAFLDLDGDDGSELLTEVVTKQILMNKGGARKGVECVAAYDRKYGRRGNLSDSAHT